LTEKIVDICILGAGPAGSGAALQLAKKGIKCALIDKAQFPREKICGDGLSGRSLVSLRVIDPEILSEIEQMPGACKSWGVKFVAPNNSSVSLDFKDPKSENPPGYVIRRKEFDNLLVKRVKQSETIDLYEGTEIDSIERTRGVTRLVSKQKDCIFTCKLLLLATGDNSGRFLQTLDENRPAGNFKPGLGIRTYFSDIRGMEEGNKIEIHFYKQLLPWYLWIFPLGEGMANVGMGMLHDSATRNEESMKKIFLDTLATEPELKERFKNASAIEDIKAARLFYFNSKKSLTGDGYMLLGDAAELVDPFTGEGIGNALMSGILAAEVASECLLKGDFSHSATMPYEESVYNKLLRELEMGLRLQNRAHNKQLINLVISRARKSRAVRNTLMKMIYNINTMGELANPLFYIKLALNL
jgi:geranylgeranyl reductase family protein